MDEEQMQMVYEYLEKANIGVDKEIDTDALLTGEDTNYLQFYLEELKEIYAKQGKNRQGKTVTNTTKQKLSKALHSYWKNSTSRQEQSQKLKNYYLNESQDILEQRFSKVKKSLKEKFSDTSIKKEIVEKQKKTIKQQQK